MLKPSCRTHTEGQPGVLRRVIALQLSWTVNPATTPLSISNKARDKAINAVTRGFSSGRAGRANATSAAPEPAQTASDRCSATPG